ncbi:ISLre2 family transposase [Lentibacillus jeotgali]|uniref:ISLre2 family transposase n=1 Tax=Lentibacillus jeotgali TaxID=558169 RepID=UPI0002625C99|nr:ISLre2 family transposase [Lentibacillus jeotgali]
MYNDTNNTTNLKAIEKSLFQQLQGYFHDILLKFLEDIDTWLMESRDHQRYKYKEKQPATIDTVFGPVTVERRKYTDREKGERVALLDQYLQFQGSDSLSPYLAELAVDWAVRGPSYRDARDRLQQLLGYQAMSHEQIRQKALHVQDVDHGVDEEKRKKVDALFLEVDGIYTPLQNHQKERREVKVGIAHEGWEKRHPGSKDFELVNKTYYHTLENGEFFWETFSRQLYEQYDLNDDTPVIINGDGAPWIREGLAYFPQAIYNYDHYHLKKWIKAALGNRSKQERRKAYLAADDYEPAGLSAAVAEAEKAEMDEDKKDDIAALRTFILDNQEAIRDYRERLQEKGVETAWMRPMGSAESNMNFFSRRLKKMGYSWSVNGLDAMTRAIIHRFDGTLGEALDLTSPSDHQDDSFQEGKVSLKRLLKQKTRQSVGAIMGSMPVLWGKEPSSYTAQALRGLAGFQST